jgi:hypothetical protein
MNRRDSIQSLLVLRKLTRAIADAVRAQMTEHLATLTPLLRPQLVLGEYIQGGPKESSRKADEALKELQALYETVAPAQPLNLRRELTPPFNVSNVSLEITPVDYTHVVQAGSDTKKITIRSPLMWTLTYTGFGPPRLQEILDAKVRGEELQRYIVSYLIMHLVTTRQRGVMQILEQLHLPVTTTTSAEFGSLPMTRIGIEIATERPSDAVVLESAELTGMDAFEEVVKVEDISRLRDPLKARLLDIVHHHAPELVSH